MTSRLPSPSLLLLALVLGCATTQPAQAGDRSLVVTIEALETFGAVVPHDSGSFETLTRSRLFDGTLEVEYEFDTTDAHPEAPYLYSLAELHPSRGDACSSHGMGILGARIGADLETHDEIFRYGDESRFAFLVDEGEPVGTFFSMCRSRTALLVMIGGLIFDDREIWRELVWPRLEALRRLEQNPH